MCSSDLALIAALDLSKSLRTMLSPAEAVNVLTVGASHADHSKAVVPDTIVDPYPALRIANLSSGIGLGFDRSVKPEILMNGGRQAAQPSVDGGLSVHAGESGHFGQGAACPDPHTGNLKASRRCAGTSNAAALATRSALIVADALDELDREDGLSPWYAKSTAPCVLKSLVAHGSGWGETGGTLAGIIPPIGKANRQREGIARHIGYGPGDIDRVIQGTQQRVTLLADEEIRIGKRHEYRIPLPADLSSRKDIRRVVLTLSWLTPIKPESMSYRAVRLNVVGETGRSGIWSGVKRLGLQPPLGVSRRGTLIHMVYQGDRAIPFLEDEDFVVNVQAQAAGGLSGLTKLDIPYALAVTFEVAATIQADIAQDIRDRVAPRIRA